MKRLTYLLFIPAFSLITACHSNNISRIGTGVKVITKCCKSFSLGSTKKHSASVSNEEKNELESSKSSLLPVNSWDAKMMIW